MRRSGLAIIIAVAAAVGGCYWTAEQAPASVRAPVEAQLSAVGIIYQRAAASPDFIRRAALSAADATDWVIDFNEARGSYCGAGGCPLQVWVMGAGGTYRLAFDQKVLGWRIDREPPGPPRLRVRLHGALCGRTAIEDCAYAFRWAADGDGNGRFVTATPAADSARHAGPLIQPIRLDPDNAPTPVRYAVKAYEAACMRAGGQPETGLSLQDLPDLNGDAAREMLFDASIAWCWRPDGTAAVRPDCKAGSCDSRLFTRDGGRWREVLAAPGLHYEIEYRNGSSPVMVVNGRPLIWSDPRPTS